jgi:hypothetical protein
VEEKKSVFFFNVHGRRGRNQWESLSSRATASLSRLFLTASPRRLPQPLTLGSCSPRFRFRPLIGREGKIFLIFLPEVGVAKASSTHAFHCTRPYFFLFAISLICMRSHVIPASKSTPSR